MFIANPGIQTQGGSKYGNHCAMLPLVTLPSISRSRIDEAELARLQDIGKLSPSVSGPTSAATLGKDSTWIGDPESKLWS